MPISNRDRALLRVPSFSRSESLPLLETVNL